jgi:spore maturation protein CgeB/SAM-dependent methyltransferase
MNRDLINQHYHGDLSDPATERARERIHWICSQANGKDILDVGCSQGIVCLILAREGFQCTGVDLEPGSLAVGEEALSHEDEAIRKRVKFLVADGSQLPFADDSFDMVVLGEVLEHLVHPDKMLAEARRVLRDGGRLVVTVPHGLNAFPDHKVTFYPVSLLLLLQPHFRTNSIGTLGEYITYTGVSDSTYDSARISKDSLFEQYLGLEKLLEGRCLAKERALLEKATDLYGQVRKLTAQTATQASRITELEKTLALRDEQVRKLETTLEQGRAALMEFRAEAVRAQTECTAQVTRFRELQESLVARDDRIRELESNVEQHRAATAAWSERLGRAEAESAAQTHKASELHEELAKKEEQIQRLQSALEQQRATVTGLGERVGRAEAESIGHAKQAKDLHDLLVAKDGRHRELETALEQARAAVGELREGRIRAEAELATQAAQIRELERAVAAKDSQVTELEKSLQQEREAAAALRKELTTAESTRARLNSEAAGAKGALQNLELRIAAVGTENSKLKEDLSAKDAAGLKQLAQIEALQAARLRQREKQQSEMLGKLECDWKRRLANQRVRDVVRLALPPGARVLVISKGDDDLLNLDGRCGMHFPQTETGVYAGYHPADSAEAIKHLEALKTKGADFLLVPASSFWWLDFYQDFRRHLENHHQVVAYDEDCLIFALRPSPQTKKRFKLSVEALSGNDLKAGVAGKSNGPSKAQAVEIALPPKNGPSPGTMPSAANSTVVVEAKRGAAKAGAAVTEPPAVVPAPAGRGQSSEAKPLVSSAGDAAGAPSKQQGKALVAGCVLDEFTAACFAPEWQSLTFRPDNWKATLEGSPINLLFVESAWKGNQGSWQYKVVSVARGDELEDLVLYCRTRGIPTAFWNKEDPVHFDRFIKSASFFDFVFTTDSDCIPRYKEHLQHDNIFALPFAAQPRIHNPILKTERLHNVSFAGAYYGISHDERRKDMDLILKPALEYGLHIFDRQHGLVGTAADQYRYPEIYQRAIKGYLPYEHMVQAYKRYRVFLNVNSVKSSPTMFSRRVFELLASGTPVVSSYAKGIENLLGNDLVLFSESEQQTKQHLERLLSDEQEWARLSTRGIRTVFDRHTYSHRCDELCRHIDSGLRPPAQPRIGVIAKAATVADLQHLAATLSRQTYRNFNVALFLGKNLKASDVEAQTNLLNGIAIQVFPGSADMLQTCVNLRNADYFWFLNLGDYYGPNFLKDCALATAYSNVDFIGKHTHFALTKSLTSPELSSRGYEFRLVDSIAPGSLLARSGSLSRAQWEIWLSQKTVSLGKERALAIDRFNYVRNAFSARKSNGRNGEDTLFKEVKA